MNATNHYNMPIFVSASSIKDYLACSKKLYYRTFLPDLGIINDPMAVGIVVHKALELYWNDYQRAKNYVKNNLNSRHVDKAIFFIENYFGSFRCVTSDEDIIEKKFKIKVGADAYLVGKIDRISNGVIIDWKTAAKPPKSIDKDIQFLIYDLAYRKMYGKPPANVLYAALTTGEFIRYIHDDALSEVLKTEIIPEVINALKDNTFTRRGMFGSSTCYSCIYKGACLGDGDVMDLPALIDEQ
jgi:CRISPR/Cas system-associated exonuclease Cas4 (RecB family)